MVKRKIVIEVYSVKGPIFGVVNGVSIGDRISPSDNYFRKILKVLLKDSKINEKLENTF